MKFLFRNKRISGILAVLPAREYSFVEEMKNYNVPPARSVKLAEVMGYSKRRMAEPDVCMSDLAVFGLQRLFDQNFLAPEEIDAILFVSQSADYIVPPTSNVIQGRLCLKHDMLCLDINQACAGFVVGLMQAFMMLEQESVRKVVLINGDVLSRKVSPRDRSIYPLVGDAATITIIERDSADGVIHGSLKMDGSRGDSISIPAGGMRLASSPETAVMEEDGDNNFRAKDHVRMDGTAIFNFVQSEVPPMVEELLATAGVSAHEVDYFLFHQANRFMLEKLADKMNIPRAKMPNDVVEHFGNSGGSTIPLSMALNLATKIKMGHIQACLAGYGGGLTWAALHMRLGGLSFCEIIDYP